MLIETINIFVIKENIRFGANFERVILQLMETFEVIAIVLVAILVATRAVVVLLV